MRRNETMGIKVIFAIGNFVNGTKTPKADISKALCDTVFVSWLKLFRMPLSELWRSPQSFSQNSENVWILLAGSTLVTVWLWNTSINNFS